MEGEYVNEDCQVLGLNQDKLLRAFGGQTLLMLGDTHIRAMFVSAVATVCPRLLVESRLTRATPPRSPPNCLLLLPSHLRGVPSSLAQAGRVWVIAVAAEAALRRCGLTCTRRAAVQPWPYRRQTLVHTTTSVRWYHAHVHSRRTRRWTVRDVFFVWG